MAPDPYFSGLLSAWLRMGSGKIRLSDSKTAWDDMLDKVDTMESATDLVSAMDKRIEDEIFEESILNLGKLKKETKPNAESDICSKETNPKDIIGSDKLPMSLIPGTTKAYLALGHLEGMLKYGQVNWRIAGVRMSIYMDAMERHMEKLKGGEWEDPLTHVPHLASILCCASILVDAHECGKLHDDRPYPAPVAEVIDRFSDTVKHLKKLFKTYTPKHWTIADDHKTSK